MLLKISGSAAAISTFASRSMRDRDLDVPPYQIVQLIGIQQWRFDGCLGAGCCSLHFRIVGRS